MTSPSEKPYGLPSTESSYDDSAASLEEVFEADAFFQQLFEADIPTAISFEGGNATTQGDDSLLPSSFQADTTDASYGNHDAAEDGGQTDGNQERPDAKVEENKRRRIFVAVSADNKETQEKNSRVLPSNEPFDLKDFKMTERPPPFDSRMRHLAQRRSC